MKTDLLDQSTDDARASSDTTSEYSLINAESPDIENMEKLREKIKDQDIIIRDFEKKLADAEMNIIHIYEATIRDKNDIIELMKENKDKDLAIKQLKDQIAVLQNAPDQNKNLSSNKDNANATESAELENKPTENAGFQTLQKQFAESQSQNETLKDINCQLKSKLDENIKELAFLKQKSDTEEHKLRAKIAELEKNVELYEAKSKEENVKLAKCALNAKSTDAHIVLLNHSKVPNINFIKIGDQDTPAIVEDIPGAGPGWTIILRRFDGSVDFTEKDLSEGVGNLGGEFWFGLESIRKLTSSTRHELYIQLVDFDDVTAYARYDNFVVGSKEERYVLKSLGSYSGNAGDALRSLVNGKMPNGYLWFSGIPNPKCCLTGEYNNSKEAHWSGFYWGNWCLGKRGSLKACKMLIRPY